MIEKIGCNEVHVWRTRASQVNDPVVVQRCLDSLDGGERDRMSRFATAELRHCYLVSHSLVRFMLSSFACVPPQAWRFGRNEWGAPYVIAPCGGAPLRFSLSHAGEYAACAVTIGREVGIDIERLPAHSEMDELIGDLAIEISESELTGLRAQAVSHRPRFFAKLWTAREAYAKACGLGLSRTAAVSSIHFEDGAAPLPGLHPLQQPEESGWRAWLNEVADDYQQAVVVRRQPGETLVIKGRQYAFAHE